MNKKDDLLYGAITIIAEEGLTNLSASKLAKKSGISKSTVFHHFKSMEDIPPLILDKLYQDIIDPLNLEDYSSLKDYLIKMGESAVTDNHDHMMIYKAFDTLYQASVHDDSLKAIVNDCSIRFESIVSQRIQSFVMDISSEEALTISQLIVSTLDGVGLHYLIHENFESSRKSWYAFVDMMIGHIENRGEQK